MIRHLILKFLVSLIIYVAYLIDIERMEQMNNLSYGYVKLSVLLVNKEVNRIWGNSYGITGLFG